MAVKGGHIHQGGVDKPSSRRWAPRRSRWRKTCSLLPFARTNESGSMIYTNRSCKPNIAIQGQIVFVAMRDIRPGEELTPRLGDHRR